MRVCIMDVIAEDDNMDGERIFLMKQLALQTLKLNSANRWNFVGEFNCSLCFVSLTKPAPIKRAVASPEY